MEKYIYRISIIILSIFSFYYTNKMIDFLREKDPIMQEIKKTKDKYTINSKDAVIVDDNIISGKKGKTIDYKESYSKMKKYGAYNETLTVLKEVTPKVSIENNYNKYIIGGNRENKSISLVFIVNKDTNINNILNILDSNKVPGTFFIDGTFLENNIKLIKCIKKHELEILSYNNSYDENLFKTSIYYLENLTNKKAKFCYTKNDNKELLKLCSKNKLHTIKPIYHYNKNIYREIKNNLNNSIIISLEINNYIEKELSTTIDYIKGKGYNLVTLNNLLKE